MRPVGSLVDDLRLLIDRFGLQLLRVVGCLEDWLLFLVTKNNAASILINVPIAMVFVVAFNFSVVWRAVVAHGDVLLAGEGCSDW